MTILNFHGLGPRPREMDAGEFHCWLDTAHFEAVLDALPAAAEVMLTFDDGNVSDHEVALPILLRRGLRATFFVCSGRLGALHFLRTAQVAALLRAGMFIGSHGVNHRPWRLVGGAELTEELHGSRRALEALCRVPVTTAACPFGGYDARVVAAARRAGYGTLYTSDGVQADFGGLLRSRTTITRDHSPEAVRTLVTRPPGAAKRWRSRLRVACKRFRPAPRAARQAR